MSTGTCLTMTRIGELAFIRFTPEPGESWARYVRSTGFVSGIYILELRDGARYVGQAKELAVRLTTHRRRHRDAVLAFQVAHCPSPLLDAAERQVIQALEGEGRSLTNKLHTNKPQGLDTIEIAVRNGAVVALPWDRTQRGGVTPPAAVETVSPLHQQRYNTAHAEDWYAPLVSACAEIVRLAVPAPTETAGELWSLSLLPETNLAPGWQRLATLNAGGLEIARFFEDTRGPSPTFPTFLNIDCPRHAHLERGRLGLSRGVRVTVDRNYKSGEVLTVHTSLQRTVEVLSSKKVQGLMYALVVRQMRRGNAVLGRHHNRYFAHDVLQVARVAAAE